MIIKNIYIQFKRIMSNKLKNKKEKEVTKEEDINFKFEDHISEASIGKILNQTYDPIILNTLGGVVPINTVVFCNWNTIIKKKKKLSIPKYKYESKKSNLKSTLDSPGLTSNSIYMMDMSEDHPQKPVKKGIYDYIPEGKDIEEKEWNPTFIDKVSYEENYLAGIDYIEKKVAISHPSPKINYGIFNSSKIRERIKYLNGIIRIQQSIPTTDKLLLESLHSNLLEVKSLITELLIRGEEYNTVEEPKKLDTYSEELKERFQGFINNYGCNPALLKGYIINDKVISNNIELVDLIKSGISINWEKAKMLIKVFNLKDDIVESKLVIKFGYKIQKVTKEANILPILPILVRLRIKSSEISNKFFNNTGTGIHNRSTLDNLITTNWSLLQNVKVTRNKVKYNTDIILVEHPDNKEEIRFVLNDCIFSNPDINGYNAPIDKTININSIVTLKESRLEKYNISREVNSYANVIAIKPNPSSKQVAKNCRNHRLDVITIKFQSNQRILQTYAQDLRFIKNKEQVNNIQDDTNIKKETIKSKSIQDYFQEVQYYTTTGSYQFIQTNF